MADDSKAATCGASLDEHIDLTLIALEAIGSGLGCETQYQALVVLVEAARQFHGFAPFDATEKVEQLIADTNKAKKAQELATGAADKASTPQPKWFIPDSSGKVH